MTTSNPSNFDIEFIDPLFAVALHLGLSHGIYQETWFRDWRLPQGDESFHLGVFALSLLTLILAWVGYHGSIRRRPVKGFGRFIVDVVLVIFYATLLVKYTDFRATLFLLMCVYALYVIWDLFKSWEYHADYANVQGLRTRYRRQIVTIIWFLVFIALWWLFSRNHLSEWSALILAYVATVGHRINKEVPIWGALGGGVAKLFVHGN